MIFVKSIKVKNRIIQSEDFGILISNIFDIVFRDQLPYHIQIHFSVKIQAIA